MGWKELEVDRIKIPYTCIKLKIRRENPSKLEQWLSGYELSLLSGDTNQLPSMCVRWFTTL